MGMEKIEEVMVIVGEAMAEVALMGEAMAEVALTEGAMVEVTKVGMITEGMMMEEVVLTLMIPITLTILMTIVSVACAWTIASTLVKDINRT